MSVFRYYTEKREGFNIEARSILVDLREFLGVTNLGALRIFNRYDIEGITAGVASKVCETVLSEPQTDDAWAEVLPDTAADWLLIIEALPGQYDQRADSCAQCIQMITRTDRPIVKTAKVYAFYGSITESDKSRLRGYLINPVETRYAARDKPVTLIEKYPEPKHVAVLDGFIGAGETELLGYQKEFGLAMDIEDLRFFQDYFKNTEKRDPTVTELRVVDTYWSDHCRHTTFNTHIIDVTIADPEVQKAYDLYLRVRREVYGDLADSRPQTLMDIATIAAKVLRKRGFLKELDISEEINACSIHVDVNAGGVTEDWLLMFKNETHNHPTEIEPFGGAATCIGGAIRDPLSGRAFVYQAMRVTGAGDPRSKVEDTLPGKLPQKKLTVTAARGYSSYGNQIGLATGLVHEFYHPGYTAKRMEIGAVVGAVKAGNVVRKTPLPGDKVILIGGRTGRDGIGGATGSSKIHNADSLVSMASEVQKGNAPEERKIQRLFLNPEVTKMIKRCNDFGAGGVSVAIGELADGVDIDLSKVRKKYEGLDGTELAVSESQERMAVVTAPGDAEKIIKKAEEENLEAYIVAEITESPRMVMRLDGKVAADLSREFLSSNGTVKRTNAAVGKYSKPPEVKPTRSPINRLREIVSDLRFCSQRGLYEMFDGTVGASSVLMKNGGKTASTPAQVMASLLPVMDAETDTCSVMSFGFDPYLSDENPYEGAKTAVVLSLAKLVASGCDPTGAYLTFQEYFERLRNEPARWGKPFAALLGALEAQMELGVAAIGGKDSMSGSFNDLDVPPTLVSFAIAANSAACVLTPEFKEAGRDVVLFRPGLTLAETRSMWNEFKKLSEKGVIASAWASGDGGAAEGIFKMAVGNGIGFISADDLDTDMLFRYEPGSIIAEVTDNVSNAVYLGKTTVEPNITMSGETACITELKDLWEQTLEGVFPTKTEEIADVESIRYDKRPTVAASETFGKPRAVIFSFPGTNSELDTAKAVRRAGGAAKVIVIKNLTPAMLEESLAEAAKLISESQMMIIPGGFSGGDEPDGSAKFITAFFRNPVMSDAVHESLKTRGGLMLGICNGFQALIKLGLVPFGEIVRPSAKNPTLTYNLIGRHQSGYVYTSVASVKSPWMNLCKPGEVHAVAISHGEGRFTADEEFFRSLAQNGQIATQYTDSSGKASMNTFCNPNGSFMAVEGLFSPDGRVFGKMCHTERRGEFVAKNIYGDKHQPIFESGVKYFADL